MAWRQILFFNRRLISAPSNSSVSTGFASFSSKSNPYIVKVGIPEFLNGVGKGVETHVEKLESEIGDFSKLLVTRTLKLKKLGIPCKHPSIPSAVFSNPRALLDILLVMLQRKLILKYTHKYRLGLWRPRADVKA